MEAWDWLDFFEFQFKCYFCLCFLERNFMFLREKHQNISNSYKLLLLSEKLFQKYRSAALMIQIVNIDKSEDVSVFLRVGRMHSCTYFMLAICHLFYCSKCHCCSINLETSQYIKDLSNRWVTFDGQTVIGCADHFCLKK